jgi:FKBP-type peptidyl-prolyl cis-trans isomerase FkpA
MKKVLLLFLFSATLCNSCDDSQHFGYSRLTKSIHYKLETIGDEQYAVSASSRLSFNLKVWSKESRLLAEKKFQRIVYDPANFPSYLVSIFNLAYENDSISIIGNSKEIQINRLLNDSLIKTPIDFIRLELKISEALSDVRLRNIIADERIKDDLELKEQRTILNIVDSLGLNAENRIGGVFIHELRDGNGGFPKSGQTVVVNFIARIPNGVIIHNTTLDGKFEYQIGVPEQVLPGLAIGIQNSRLGSKTLVVVPSELGFGANGSTTGIVPPYTPIIYEIEVLEIRG